MVWVEKLDVDGNCTPEFSADLNGTISMSNDAVPRLRNGNVNQLGVSEPILRRTAVLRVGTRRRIVNAKASALR